ncbi:PsiF family protein [Azospira restricta]|uniref:Phosphate starvation-inducible protein PsiF n=1 Tax=Azospira restricta TaxID=404405 RepID=A0A974SQ25_9RHOO|nr:PsiF family protein [Azospira restricta]QRJ64304.1 phosphate starvation-inducible protein PsiF [Azospira restricta]
MKLAIALVSLALAAGTAFAEEKKADAPKKEPSAAQKAQQAKMKDCNAQAAGKTGDERKAFMKQCLSGGHAADSGCAAQAADKKLAGAAKTSFMKKCEADAPAATK